MSSAVPSIDWIDCHSSPLGATTDNVASPPFPTANLSFTTLVFTLERLEHFLVLYHMIYGNTSSK